MPIALNQVHVRSARRVRLVFSTGLASGAFATSWYSFASLDQVGSAPSVAEAMAVAGVGHELELALGQDLVGSGRYRLTVAAGVPALDASTTAETPYDFTAPAARQAVSQSLSVDDLSAQVFGVDLLHNGEDFVETPDGDLATLGGADNVVAAVTRRLMSEGLVHAPGYGAQARRFVDAPTPNLPSLRVALERQARADRRVAAAQVVVEADDNDGTVSLGGTITLIGNLRREFKETL